MKTGFCEAQKQGMKMYIDGKRKSKLLCKNI